MRPDLLMCTQLIFIVSLQTAEIRTRERLAATIKVKGTITWGSEALTYSYVQCTSTARNTIGY